MPNVYGPTVDEQTRCIHYHGPTDIIAIKFHCCGKYYPCYQCHHACEEHEISVWNKAAFHQYAILCGVCGEELTINEYLHTKQCIHCRAPFNVGCKMHYHIYFEL
ncbi:CHY zinc finger protein [Virgibacillus halophilus]|uniref:CHY zinc finger protein n=1 Tax=Tigheibacillus halophilus TaxID=361280 RepID=A0ABU5C8V1_9BACI|nr:CHY zinc finger protein [Virgibacillus halophilus]